MAAGDGDGASGKGNAAEQLWLWPGQERISAGSWIQKDEENCHFS